MWWACLCNNSKWCLPSIVSPSSCTMLLQCFLLSITAFTRAYIGGGTLCNIFTRKRGLALLFWRGYDTCTCCRHTCTCTCIWDRINHFSAFSPSSLPPLPLLSSLLTLSPAPLPLLLPFLSSSPPSPPPLPLHLPSLSSLPSPSPPPLPLLLPSLTFPL